MELLPLADALSRCPTMSDKLSHITTEGKLDTLYANIACGVSVEDLGFSLGISRDKMELLLQHTPEAQNKYLTAITSAISLKSLQCIDLASEELSFSKERSAAMAHHRQVAEMGIRAVGKLAELLRPKTDNAPTIIVNNNNQIGGGVVPSLPNELTGLVIEHGS
jgi:hypothetical protein